MSEDFRHGAINQPIRRGLHRMVRKMAGKRLAGGIGVDWTTGSRFRNDLELHLPRKNQGDNDSCSGQAGSYFLQIQRILQKVNEGELSAKSIYDPIAYSTGGTTISKLMTQIGAHGTNLESAVPSYDSKGTPLSEPLMTNKSSQTAAFVSDALTRAGYTPWDINDDIDSVAEAINTYGAVIWMIAGQNGNFPDWRSPTPQPPSSTNPNPLWYHFMCAYDFEIDSGGKKRIIALQSEGPTWGHNGVQYFYENYFTGKWLDAFTFIYDLNLVPNSDNHSTWAEVSRWFRIFLASLKK